MSVRWFSLVGLLGVVACNSTNEQITLVFPSESSQVPIDAVVVTVVEPLLGADDDLRFVGCDRIGTFGPVSGIAIGDSEVRELARRRFTFPLEGAVEVGFGDLPSGGSNPWGVLAVFFEARGTVVAERGGVAPEATLLSGCYCVRTRTGRASDAPLLDDEVRERCPLLGGREGQSTQSRTIPLRPVAPPEFRLEPCGPDSAGALASGVTRPGPSVCLRTESCDDAGRPPCFECEAPCPELSDASGAAIEFRIPTVGVPGGVPVQRVLTDRRGRASPPLELEDCSEPFEVEARLFGRSEAVRFRVDCVAPTGSWSVHDERPLPGARVLDVASVPGLAGGPDRLVVLTRRSDQPFQAEVQMFGLVAGELQPLTGTSTVFSGVTGHGVTAFRTVAGPATSPVQIAVAVGVGAGEEREVELRLLEWDGASLTRGAVLDAPCARCSCGTLASCQGEAACGAGETCQDGLCREAQARSCTRNDDCGGGNSRCVQGLCAETNRIACFGPENCPGIGRLCVDALCRRALRCTGSSDCTENEACIDGFCSPIELRPCFDKSDCASGSICRAGVCEPAGPCTCGSPVTPDLPVNLRPSDVDGDGLTDLALGAEGGQTITFHYADPASGRLHPQRCDCARVVPPSVRFDVLQLGADALTDGASLGGDLLVAVNNGAHVRYGESLEGAARITCGQAPRLAETFTVRDAVGVPTRCGIGEVDCPFPDDAVLLGEVDDAMVRIAFGSGDDITDNELLFEQPMTHEEIFFDDVAIGGSANDPQTVEAADFNADGQWDLAALFRSTRDVRVLLGTGRGSFVMAPEPLRLGALTDSCVTLSRFAVPDLDGDGAADVAVVCNPTSSPRLVALEVERL